MPSKTKRLCPRCRRLVPAGPCPRCSKPFANSKRPQNTGDSRYRRRRRSYLIAHPMCAVPGCPKLADRLDHVIPWSQRGAMTREQWDDEGNWQGLCADHHDDKTQAESRGETWRP